MMKLSDGCAGEGGSSGVGGSYGEGSCSGVSRSCIRSRSVRGGGSALVFLLVFHLSSVVVLACHSLGVVPSDNLLTDFRTGAGTTSPTGVNTLSQINKNPVPPISTGISSLTGTGTGTGTGSSTSTGSATTSPTSTGPGTPFPTGSSPGTGTGSSLQQQRLQGKVQDRVTEEGVPGATVEVVERGAGQVTDVGGAWPCENRLEGGST